MAQVYTPGLTVAASGRWRRRRVLPISGDVLVSAGQNVAACDIVARTLMPGDAIPVNVSKKLGITASELSRCMLHKPGDHVHLGEPLARSKGMFGLFPSEFLSPLDGVVESISKVTGQVLFRGEPIAVQVMAYLTGQILEIIPQEGVVVESEAALVQGIFGVGGEAYGRLHVVTKGPDEDLTETLITQDHRSKVIVGGRRITGAAVRRAVQMGVSAVVAGGIDDHDLREILGYDLGVAVTGTEKIGTTIIITEGFGEIAMASRTFDLLKSHDGQESSVNGSTQIRAGVMRPEIVIPLLGAVPAKRPATGRIEGALVPGAPVRIIREPYFGQLGSVTELPHEPMLLASESMARVVKIQLAGGAQVIVPRANVELIEG